jgi:hypothetical protein
MSLAAGAVTAESKIEKSRRVDAFMRMVLC